MFNFRHLAIDYLHPMTPNKGGIFVKRTSFLEGVDYQVFIRPFKKWTWIMLIVSSFVMALFTVAVWKILNQQKITLRYSIKIAITSFQTNFGFGNFHSLPNIGLLTPKVIALISLLLGNVIWLSYNGSLLSGLSCQSVTELPDRCAAAALFEYVSIFRGSTCQTSLWMKDVLPS